MITPSPQDFLDQVREVIDTRGETHGDWWTNHLDIAARWTRVVGRSVTPSKVAQMMIELKLSRMATGDHAEPDHLRDVIGYAAIALACLDEEKRHHG